MYCRERDHSLCSLCGGMWCPCPHPSHTLPPFPFPPHLFPTRPNRQYSKMTRTQQGSAVAQAAAKRVVKLALDHGSVDDISVVSEIGVPWWQDGVSRIGSRIGEAG